MKICLAVLMMAGAAAVRADVLGSATSDAVALDLGVAVTQVEKLGFSETVSADAQYSSTGMTARVLADGVELAAEAGKAVWTPTAVGVHTLTHQVLADGEVVGEERTVRREIWDDSVTIDRAETTLRTLLPTTFDRVTSVTVDPSVKDLTVGALEGCTGLRNLTLTNPNQTMASLMGEARSGVETIEIAEGTETLPENFFAGCSSLRSVKLPQSLKSMAGNNLRDVGKLMENREDGYWVESGWVLGYKGVCPPEIPASEQIKGVCDGALKGCMELKYFRPTGANLTYIGSEAFSGCMRLETIVFPDSLETIGDEAFYQCTRIQSVMIPGSVKSVGDGAFKLCTSLGPHGVGIAFGVEWIGKEAFYQDWRVEEVAFPSTVRFIGANAFGGDSSVSRVTVRADIRPLREIFFLCELIREAVVHPSDGMAVDWCFSGFTELTNVCFLGDAPALENAGRWFYENTPEALVTYVDEESAGWDGVPGSLALPKAWPLDGTMRRAIDYGSALTYEVTFDPNDGSQDAQVVRQNLEKPFALPSPPQRNGYTFNGWWTSPVGGWQVTDKTIFVPGAYQRLYAVWRESEFMIVDGVLTQYNGPGGAVTIPSGVTSIGIGAFRSCKGLTSVTIPLGVAHIEDFAFSFCGGLTSVTLPPGVLSIGDFAFSNCGGLTAIQMPSSVLSIGECAFADCSGLTSVTVPTGVTSIGASAFSGCSSLPDIVVADDNAAYCSLDGILYDKTMFELIQCPAGKSGAVVIPSDVRKIGEWAFADCAGITSVVIPSSVGIIGQSAFVNCRGLGSMKIPSSVGHVAEAAFSGCNGLRTVTIGEGVRSIDDWAFEFCRGLKTVTIPSSIASIGQNAFDRCSFLTVVHVSNNGDIDAVRRMLSASGFNVDNLTFDHEEAPCEVVFDAKGGIGTMESQYFDSGHVYRLPPCTFKPPTGKRFAGWACSNGKRYDDGMLVFNLAQPGETVTMTAIWEDR